MKTLDEVLKDNEKLTADLQTAGATLKTAQDALVAEQGRVTLAEATILDLTGKLTTAETSATTLTATNADLTAKNADLTAKNADFNKAVAAELAKHGIAPNATEQPKANQGGDLLAQYEAAKGNPVARAIFVRAHGQELLTLLNSQPQA